MADTQEPPNPDGSLGCATHVARPAGGRQHLSAINHGQVGDATSPSQSPSNNGGNQCRAPKTIATGRPVMSIAACQRQLRAAAIFHKQTEARIENMKKAVLQANASVKLLREGREQGKSNESVAQMVNLIQGLARGADDFRLAQEDAVMAMQALLSSSNENGINSPVEKERIIEHFQNIEKTKLAQLEGERRLDALLAALPPPVHHPRPMHVFSGSSSLPILPSQSTSRPPVPLPASLAPRQAAPPSGSLPCPDSPGRGDMATDLDPAEPSSSPPDFCQKLGHADREPPAQENDEINCWMNDEPLASPPKLKPRQAQGALKPPSQAFLPSTLATGSTAQRLDGVQDAQRNPEATGGDMAQVAIGTQHGLEYLGNQDGAAQQSGLGAWHGGGVGGADGADGDDGGGGGDGDDGGGGGGGGAGDAGIQGAARNALAGDHVEHTVTATVQGGVREMGSRREALARDGSVAENAASGAGGSSSSSIFKGARSKIDDEDASSGRLRVLEDMTSPQGFHFRAGEVCTLVREGSMGWTLVRDASGKLSWLPSDKVEVAASSEGVGGEGGSRAMQNALEAVMLNAAESDTVVGPGPGLARGTTTAAASGGGNNAAGFGFGSPRGKLVTGKGGTGVVGMALGRDIRGNIVVVALREDGPAHSCQMITPGDILVAIDSYNVHSSDDLEQVSCMLSGTPSSVVSLVVEKPEGSRLVAHLTRKTPALLNIASPSTHSASLSGSGNSAPLSGSRRQACPPISPVLSSTSPSSPNPASPSVLIFSPQEGDALFTTQSRLMAGRGAGTQSSVGVQDGSEDVSTSRLFSLSPSASPCLSLDLEASNSNHRPSHNMSSGADNKTSTHDDGGNDGDDDRIALSMMLSSVSSQNRVARMLNDAARDLYTINGPPTSTPHAGALLDSYRDNPSSYPLSIVCDAMHPSLPPHAAKRPFMVSPSPVKPRGYWSGEGFSPLDRGTSPLSLVRD